MPSAPRAPTRVLAWPAQRSRNPYTSLLYESVTSAAGANGESVTIDEFRPLTAWSRSADIVHVHWPELCLASASRVKATVKMALVLFGLRILVWRGATLVWTRHNTTSHDQVHPRLERVLRRRFDAMVHGVIDLTAGAVDTALPVGVDRVVIPHGDFAAALVHKDRVSARRSLGVADHETLLVSVGSIRPYKELAALMRAFVAGADRLPAARLLIAGPVDDRSVGAELERVAAGHDRIQLRLGWLADDEIAEVLAAADGVVLGYRRLENSGVALLALTAGRPVAATDGPAVEELLGVVGDDWVWPMDHPVDPAELVDVAEWTQRPRADSPDLSRYSWGAIGRATLDAYDRFRSGAFS